VSLNTIPEGDIIDELTVGPMMSKELLPFYVKGMVNKKEMEIR